MYLRIGDHNVTQLASKVQTSGGKNSCARQLVADIFQPPFDDAVPKVAINIGDTVTFKADGHEFYGVVFTVKRSTNAQTVTVTAFDMCIYAKKNKICFKAKSQTPEEVAKALFTKNGLPFGHLEQTGFKFSQVFYDTSIYDAIMTGYGYAANETGERYYMCADKTKICVKRKGAYVAAIIKPKQNLINASYTVSAQNAVNRVEVRDDDGKLVTVYKGDDTSYGICIDIIKKSETAKAEAKKLLRDGALEKTATVENLGNPYCISGNAVIIQEPYTEMYGLFYIDSDTHTWQKGLYQNKLTLNYRNIMDKESVYRAQKQSSSSSKKQSSDTSDTAEQIYTDPEGNVYEW